MPAEDVLTEHLTIFLVKYLRHQVGHHPLVKLGFSGILRLRAEDGRWKICIAYQGKAYPQNKHG